MHCQNFFFWSVHFVHGHALSIFFFFLVRPLCSWACIVNFFFGVRPFFGLSFFGRGFVEVTKCYLVTLLVVRFGRGLVEVIKCYLVTLLVVHLGSWTC